MVLDCALMKIILLHKMNSTVSTTVQFSLIRNVIYPFKGPDWIGPDLRLSPNNSAHQISTIYIHTHTKKWDGLGAT